MPADIYAELIDLVRDEVPDAISEEVVRYCDGLAVRCTEVRREWGMEGELTSVDAADWILREEEGVAAVVRWILRAREEAAGAPQT